VPEITNYLFKLLTVQFLVMLIPVSVILGILALFTKGKRKRKFRKLAITVCIGAVVLLFSFGLVWLFTQQGDFGFLG
jgi:hypothetical protein